MASEEPSFVLPHMGWNDVSFDGDALIFEGIENPSPFYFVHSYHVNLVDDSDMVARSEHYGHVTACIQKGMTFGVSFSPREKPVCGASAVKEFFVEIDCHA